MNPTLLRQIYGQHGIKKKVLRWTKRPKANTEKKFEKLKEQLRAEVTSAKAQGYELCYTDECLFTRRTVPKSEWAHRRTNVEVDMAQLDEPAYALILAVSSEHGVVCRKTFKKSVNVAKFLEYIEQLREETQGRKICLFWDNLSVHRSRQVTDRLDALGIRYIFNLPASPDYNGVEGCFSKIKQSFKVQRLQKMARGIKPNIQTLIHRAVNTLTMKDIRNFIEYSDKKLSD